MGRRGREIGPVRKKDPRKKEPRIEPDIKEKTLATLLGAAGNAAEKSKEKRRIILDFTTAGSAT